MPSTSGKRSKFRKAMPKKTVAGVKMLPDGSQILPSGIKLSATKIVSSTLPIVNNKIVGRSPEEYARRTEEAKRKKKMPAVKGTKAWYPQGPTSNGIGVGP